MDADGTSTLAVNGDVDMTNVATYTSQAQHLLDSDGIQTLIIDLAGTEFIDSQGIGFLIEARNIGLKRDIDIRLRAVPPRVMKVLQITGLAPVFTIDA